MSGVEGREKRRRGEEEEGGSASGAIALLLVLSNDIVSCYTAETNQSGGR